MEIYISWCPGLEESPEAVKIIKDCKLISGLEVWDYAMAGSIRRSGLKVSIHNPIKTIMQDLSEENLINVMRKNNGLLSAISHSDSKVIGFHMYYKAYAIYKHLREGASLEGVDLKKHEPSELIKVVSKNLVLLEQEINKSLAGDEKKSILFETWPYFDLASIIGKGVPIRKDFQELNEAAGAFNTPEFIQQILNSPEVLSNPRIGLLFDISHIFCAVNNIIRNKGISENVEHYIDRIIDVSKGRVHQLHLNVPTRKGDGLYFDSHHAFEKDDELSQLMLSIGKKVLAANPDLGTITLEVDTNGGPVAHAKKLVEQTKLIVKELGIEKNEN